MSVRVIIKGFVQGVGFRYFLFGRTKRLNIKGWVKNSGDGFVIAEFSGDKESVEKMIEYCRTGPEDAIVKEVQVTSGEGEEYDSFQILPT